MRDCRTSLNGLWWGVMRIASTASGRRKQGRVLECFTMYLDATRSHCKGISKWPQERSAASRTTTQRGCSGVSAHRGSLRPFVQNWTGAPHWANKSAAVVHPVVRALSPSHRRVWEGNLWRTVDGISCRRYSVLGAHWSVVFKDGRRSQAANDR